MDPTLRANKNPTYRSFYSMHRRCRDPEKAQHYGSIGIDPRWNDYAAFLEDMGPRPEGLTIDRKDSTKDYSKENCRWATPREHANNRRSITPSRLMGKRRR